MMPSDPVAGAIIAGGRSQRFSGQDKCRLLVGGRPIIVRQVEAFQPVVDTIFVVGGDPLRFADLGLSVYADLMPDGGVLGGIATALSATSASRVLTVACDLPFLTTPLLRRLCELAEEADGAWVSGARGVEPLVACYQRRILPVILARLASGQRKAASLDEVVTLRRLAEPELAVYGPPDPLTNINTPDEYARVQ